MLRRESESKKKVFHDLLSKNWFLVATTVAARKQIYDARTGNFSKKRTREIGTSMKLSWIPQLLSICANLFKYYVLLMSSTRSISDVSKPFKRQSDLIDPSKQMDFIIQPSCHWLRFLKIFRRHSYEINVRK